MLRALEETDMKLSIALSAPLMIWLVVASTEKADALVYCQYPGTPPGCVERPGSGLAPTYDVRKVPPSIEAPARGFILRQDLFDRNNPNNLRSDWHSPPAQPGQF
jgi:hypothetical protein